MKNNIIKDINTYLLSKNINQNFKLIYSSYEDFHYQTSLLFSLKNNKNFDTTDFLNYLKNTKNYDKVEITGNGFLSFKLSNFSYENESIKKQEKIIVDYCGINIAKKMHIGHIRSMFTGDFLVRLHQYLGNEVFIFNHIGDCGNQFGYLINYIISNDIKEFNSQELTELYKKAFVKYSEDENFKENSDLIATSLQKKSNLKVLEIWNKCVETSLKDLEKFINLFSLKMNLKNVQGESFYYDMCNDIVEDLIFKKIVKVDIDNSVYFEYKNSKIVLKKSNGNFLYSTYDLAAIKWRKDNINPDKIFYVVDKRQSKHFDLIFEISKQAGYSKNVELIHVPFGTIIDKSGKPLKTKSGESLYLEDMLNDGYDEISKFEYIQKIPEQIKNKMINTALISALKFYDLKFSKDSDYFFDWNNIFDIKGGTSGYIQQTYVRIESLILKSNIELDNIEFNSLNLNDEENYILFNSYKLKEIIDNFEGFQSNLIINQLIYLCAIFNKYYENNNINSASDKINKLKLIMNIKNNIKLSGDILGLTFYKPFKTQ
jgi:arginyl-tRNA synthetase